MKKFFFAKNVKQYFIIAGIFLLSAACNKQTPKPSISAQPANQPVATTTVQTSGQNQPAKSTWKIYHGASFSFDYPAQVALFTYTPQGAQVPVFSEGLEDAGLNLTGGGTFLIDKTPQTELSDAVVNDFFNVIPPSDLEKTSISQGGTAGVRVKITSDPTLKANKTWYYFQTPRGVYEVVLTNEGKGQAQRLALEATLNKLFSSLRFGK